MTFTELLLNLSSPSFRLYVKGEVKMTVWATVLLTVDSNDFGRN